MILVMAEKTYSRLFYALVVLLVLGFLLSITVYRPQVISLHDAFFGKLSLVCGMREPTFPKDDFVTPSTLPNPATSGGSISKRAMPTYDELLAKVGASMWGGDGILSWTLGKGKCCR